MSTLQPALFIGIGVQGRQVLQHLKGQTLLSHSMVPALRWLALDVQQASITNSPSRAGDEVNGLDAEEMFWLPWQESDACCVSRAKSQQAFRARIEELADLIRQILPTLTSYETVAAVEAAGFQIDDSLQVGLYIVASLGDPVGGSLAEEVAYLLSGICHQQGREPRCAGVFFVPDATQADPVAEANAYAALKELDAFITDPSCRQNGLPTHLTPAFPFDHEVQPVFDRGCYLLDTVNEQALTVPVKVLVEQAAQWLYVMGVLGLYRLLDDALDQRYVRRTIRRKVRVYGSFGLASHTLPTSALRDWCAARLGQTIVRQGLLNEGAGNLPVGTVEDFVSRNSLRVPDLLPLLRVLIGTVVSEEGVQHLRAGHLQELDNRLRGALRQIREADLPVWQRQVRNQMTVLNRQVSDSLARKLVALMRQSPIGAVAVAREFLNHLDGEMVSQREVLAQQEKQYSAHRHQVIAQASRLSYQLRSTLMSLPPRPVLALTALGGVLFPLAYWLVVLPSFLRSQTGARAWLVWPVLLGGVGLVAVYHLWAARQQSQKQRSEYIEHLHTRAELELAPLVAHAASALYEQVRGTISALNSNLDQLALSLAQTAENMAVLEQEATDVMVEQARPGPRQSLLTPSLAEQVYQRHKGDPKKHLLAVVEALGPPDQWATCSANDLNSRILTHALAHFQEASSLRAEEVLRQQSATSEELVQWLAGLLHRAAPRCAFSAVKPSQSRVPSQITRVLILDETLDSDLPSLFTTLAPDAKVLSTGNVRTVTVVSLRLGLPAFALRRMDQYWAAYANAIQQGDVSMHASPGNLLLPEPTPAQVGLPERAALFAAGLGLGLIHRDGAGSFLVKDGAGQSVALGSRKEPAAVLLGRWSGGARALHRAIRATVADLGSRTTVDQLQGYLHSTTDLSVWERQAIQQFIASLH